MGNVFDELAQMLNRLPEQIQEAYEEATKEAIDKAAVEFENNLKRMSGSSSLNANMISGKVERPHEYYERNIDWDNTKIVNEDKGKSYGRDSTKLRVSRKRNFSLRPATYHDLAYIINYGHLTGDTFIGGNHFINKAKRRIKWQKERTKLFSKKLNEISKKGI